MTGGAAFLVMMFWLSRLLKRIQQIGFWDEPSAERVGGTFERLKNTTIHRCKAADWQQQFFMRLRLPARQKCRAIYGSKVSRVKQGLYAQGPFNSARSAKFSFGIWGFGRPQKCGRLFNPCKMQENE